MTPGAFCTALLHTRDVGSAARFYRAVFGWDADRTEGATRFMLGGRCVAGAQPVADDAGRWIPYVAVENVQAATEAALRAGGIVVGTAPDPAAASPRSLVSDPDGAVFGLCTTTDPHVVALTDDPGSIWWIEVLTNTPAVLRAFYGGLFAWRFAERPLDPHPLYVTCMLGDAQVGGMLPIGPGWTTSPRWQVLFAVEHLESSVERVVTAGGQVEFGPFEVPSAGRLTSVRDPGGALFVLMQPRPR